MQLDYGTESLKREHDFTFTVRIQFWRLVTVNTLNIADWKKRNRNSRPEVFCKKSVLRNFTKFTGKQLCQSLFFLKKKALACNFIKKETLAQMLCCEYCEISKNTFFYRTPLLAASKERKATKSILNLLLVNLLENFEHSWLRTQHLPRMVKMYDGEEVEIK